MLCLVSSQSHWIKNRSTHCTKRVMQGEIHDCDHSARVTSSMSTVSHIREASVNGHALCSVLSISLNLDAPGCQKRVQDDFIKSANIAEKKLKWEER